jgi:prevent-host-death family protein
MQHRSAEAFRDQFPDLLVAAERGQSTIITKNGRPVAALVPIGVAGCAQHPLLPAEASGRGLWKIGGAQRRKLREEWSR